MDNETGYIKLTNSRFMIFNKINTILMLAYIVSGIITPADSFNIKKIAFILLFILNFNLIFNLSFKREFNIIGFHIFVFSSLLFVFSIIIGGNIYATISNVYLCLYASLILVVIYRKINLEYMLLFSLTVIALLMVGSVILDFFGVIDIYGNNIMMFLHNNSEAMIGKSTTYWSYYIVFLKASPLILVLLGYSLFTRRFYLALLATMALILSGTRANLFGAIVLIFGYIFKIQKKIIWRIITVFVFVIVFTIFYESINDYFSYMFISKSYSTANKMDDLKEIFSVFSKYPLTFFVGTGFGAEEKFSILNGTAEWSLFDMWRKNGLIGLSIFSYFVVKPIKRIWNNKERQWVVFSYITYLFVAMTNPLFFSSTAYVMYVYIYSKYYDIKRLN